VTGPRRYAVRYTAHQAVVAMLASDSGGRRLGHITSRGSSLLVAYTGEEIEALHAALLAAMVHPDPDQAVLPPELVRSTARVVMLGRHGQLSDQARAALNTTCVVWVLGCLAAVVGLAGGVAWLVGAGLVGALAYTTVGAAPAVGEWRIRRRR